MNLKEAVAECVEILRGKATMKRVQLISDVEERFPTQVMIDGNRVKQIVINLVSNAIKYTQAGRVCVKLVSDQDRVKISVTDTGIGIEP